MQYRLLGRTGVNVSEISLGAEHLVDKPQNVVTDVVSAMVDHGANYVDIFMPQAEVRTMLGNALRGKRDKMMVAGHIGAALTEDGQYLRTRDMALSVKFLEDFIQRVGGDCIDMLMLHYVDEMEDAAQVTAMDGQLELALKMKKEGKIRFIGLSSHVPSVAQHLVETDALDAVMFPVNPLHDTLNSEDIFEDASYANVTSGRSDARRAFFAACQRHGTAIVVMKAYGAGRLFSDASPLGIKMTPSQCLHYALSQPSVATAAVGCQTVEEVERAMEYLTATDAQKDYSIIRESRIYKDQSAACMYCNHCLPCPAGIDIAATTRLLDAAYQGGVNQRLTDAYQSLAVKPDACIECGGCNTRCPFGVDAQFNMQKSHSMFDMMTDG